MEFALVAPMFFLLFFAVFDFARLFYAEMTLQNAVRQAGRYAVTGNHLPDPKHAGQNLSRVNSIIQVAQRAAMGLSVSKIQVSSADDDDVAMVSFASNATVDVPIKHNFITPITNAAKALSFGGGTFGLGGLTAAKAQNESVTVQPGQNVVKVAVYFTDGYVNVIQDTFNCGPGHPTLYNYGGYDTGTSVDFFDPSSGTDWGGLDAQGYPRHSPSPDCTGVTKFTSAIDGTLESFTRANVTADAQYRALQIANAMRTEGMVVYSIGLGSNVDQSFLRQIANDPASPSYNSSQPQGLAVFASNCPSTQCSAELLQVFQTIAAKILLRLTQ